MADNWRPLLAVADAIGGSWPEQARAIALTMAKGKLADNVSLRVQLLRDIRAAFAPKGGASVGPSDLVSALRRPDRPWNDYGRGKALSAHTLARLLEPFGIQPTQIRIGDRNIRGYRIEQFSDAFDRYLAPEAVANTKIQLPVLSPLSNRYAATRH